MWPIPVGRIAFLKPNSLDSARWCTLRPKRPVNRSIAASRSRTTTVSSTTSPSMARLLGTVERDHTVESPRSTPHGPINSRRAAVLLRLVHRRDRVRHDGRRRQRAHRVLALLPADPSCVGFALSYPLLLAMRQHPTPLLLYSMVFAQGVFGYGLASVFGAIPAELFQGKHYGTIFGTLSLASIVGGAIGPWVAGALHDRTGSYVLAFWLAVGACVVSAGAMWLAAPRKVRAVAGRVHRRSQGPPAGAGAI